MTQPVELSTLPFESKKKFADWLAKDYGKSSGACIDTISTPLNLTSVPAWSVF
ncbi:MAG: hypothetical protein IH589_07080 [Anaerolineales bacterium]|nr:hypothetical protein [Anaerolineales bacterium]